MPKRELSTSWWNVIRRKMTATPAKEYLTACPDCGSLMWLMRGKYGRFYKCRRLDCRGTKGAHLDGRPRRDTGPEPLIRARRQARDAIHKIVLERTRRYRKENAEAKARGRAWWTHHHLACCEFDFQDVLGMANLPPVPIHPSRRRRWTPPWEPKGFNLRKRTIEECERIAQAADVVLRRLRGHAWDRVLVDALDASLKAFE